MDLRTNVMAAGTQQRTKLGEHRNRVGVQRPPRQSARSIRPQALPDLAQAVVGHGTPVVVVTGTVVAVVVVTGTVVAVVVVTGTVVAVVVVVAGTVVVVVATVVVVGRLVVVVVDRGSVVRVVVVAPRVVVVVLFVVAVVIGGLAVVTTMVPGGTVRAVVTVLPLTSALRNADMRPEPGTANVVVDLGEVVADAPGDAARGTAATTEVGTGTNGTPVALSARTGASVGACE